MSRIQRPISVPEPTNDVDALWKTTQVLKEVVEIMQGIRGNREVALKCDLDDLSTEVTNNIITGGAGGNTLAGLADTDLTGQVQYDLLYNADGVNWEDTAGNLQWNTSAQYLQLAGGYTVNWLDSSLTSVRLLDFDSDVFTVGDPTYPLDLDATRVELKTGIGINWQSLGGTSVEHLNFRNNSFYVGSPAFPTELDGTFIGLKNDIGINWDNQLGSNVELLVLNEVTGTAGGSVESCYALNLANDPLWNDVTLLLPFEGTDGATTTEDLSANDLTPTFNGTAQIDTAQSICGSSSLLLDGNSDTVTFAKNDAAFEVNGNPGELRATTIEFFFRWDGVGAATDRCIINYGGESGVRFPNWMVSLNTSNQLNVILSDAGNAPGFITHNITDTTTTIVADTWYYVTVEYSGAGNDLYLYVDGVQTASDTTAGNVPETEYVSAELAIGNQGGTSQWFGGHVDGLRITQNQQRYNGTHSVPTSIPSPVEAFIVGDPAYYTEIDGTAVGLKNNIGINWDNLSGDDVELLNFALDLTSGAFCYGSDLATDPLWNDVTCLLPFEGVDGQKTTEDLSATNAVVTFVGNTEIDTASFVCGTSSLYLEGAVSPASYVSLPANNSAYEIDGHPTTGRDTTIEFFFRWDGVTVLETVVQYAADAATSKPNWRFQITSGSKLQFQTAQIQTVDATGFDTHVITSTTTIVADTWYHVAGVYDTSVGVGGGLYLYIDGVLEDSDETTGNYPRTANTDLPLVFGFYTGGSQYFAGQIDGFRITQNQTRYTANFTPPTTISSSGFFVGDPNYNTRIDGSETTINDGSSQFARFYDAGNQPTAAFPYAIAGDTGFEDDGITVDGTDYDSVSKVSDIGGTNKAMLHLHRHSLTLSPNLVASRANSEDTTHGNVANDDALMSFIATGWHTDSYHTSSEIRMEVDGTPSATAMPGQLTFMTAPSGTRVPIDRMRIRADGSVEFVDPGGTDWAAFSHDGTDFDTVFTNTADWDITGLTGEMFVDAELRVSGRGVFTNTAATAADPAIELNAANPMLTFYESDQALNEKLWSFQASSGSFEAWIVEDAGGNTNRTQWLDITRTGFASVDQITFTATDTRFVGDVQILSGNSFFVYDTGNTDWAEFSHDSTDFNTAFTQTADWNITGHTGVVAIEATADTVLRLTKGIEASQARLDFNNELDVLKWTFGISSDTNEDFFFARYNDAGVFQDLPIYIVNSTGAVQIRDGNSFYILDTGDTDWAEFNHDGADFNTTFVNTTDWNITGASAIRFDNFVINPTAGVVQVRDGDSFRVADSLNTSYLDLAHDGTDLNVTHASTTDWNITGITAIQADTVTSFWQRLTADGAGSRTNAGLRLSPAVTGTAGIYLQANGGAADEDNWSIDALNTGVFRIATATDLDALGENVFEITRTGTAADEISLLGGLLSVTPTVVTATENVNIDKNGSILFQARPDSINNLTTSIGSGSTADHIMGMVSDVDADHLAFQLYPQGGTVNARTSFFANGTTQEYGFAQSWTSLGQYDFTIYSGSTEEMRGDFATGWFGTRTGNQFRVYDTANIDYIKMSHNGVDAFMDAVGTTWWRWNNDNNTNGALWLQGFEHRIYSAGNDKYMSMLHNDTDFTFSAVTTTDVNFYGATTSYEFDNLVRVFQSGGTAADALHLRDTTDSTDFLIRYDGVDWGFYNASAVTQFMEFDDSLGRVNMYNNNTLRLQTWGSGSIAIKRDGNTDAEINAIQFQHQDATLRGRYGFIANNDSMYWRNQIHGGTNRIEAENTAAGTVRVGFVQDPDATTLVRAVTDVEIEVNNNENAIIARANGEVELYYNAIEQASTRDGAFGVQRFFQNRTATTTELNDSTNAVNTSNGKIAGAQVYNSTTGLPVWADGNANNSTWSDATGTVAHTPTP